GVQPLAVHAVVQDARPAGGEKTLGVVADGAVGPVRAQVTLATIRPDNQVPPHAAGIRVFDDRGDAHAAPGGDVLRDGVEFGKAAPGNRFDEDVDDSTAGQAHGKGIVIADPVAHQGRLAVVLDLGGELVRGPLDAAAG